MAESRGARVRSIVAPFLWLAVFMDYISSLWGGGGAGGGRWGAGRPPARFESVKGVWLRGLPARSAKRSAFRPNPSAFPRPLGLILVPRARMAGRGGVWGPGGGAKVNPLKRNVPIKDITHDNFSLSFLDKVI